MTLTIPFGARSSADEVIAGIDLTRHNMVVTDCDSTIGFRTMTALAANGAHVIGMARSFPIASAACKAAGYRCSPVACDFTDFDSVSRAVDAMELAAEPLDAIVTSSGVRMFQAGTTRYGIEMHFLAQYLTPFALVTRLSGLLRGGSGRIVIASDDTASKSAPAGGVMFDNLDGRRFYDAKVFFAQAQLACALFARELARRMTLRGVSVNTYREGNFVAETAAEARNRQWRMRLIASLKALVHRTIRGNAGTPTLLAANPQVAGHTGLHWHGCQIQANELVADSNIAGKLWEVSDQLIARLSGVK
jgi:WW domain-containing oxidoreductase